MKTYSDPEILTRYPEPCTIAESYGFESLLFQSSGNASIGGKFAELPVFTFYLEVPDDLGNRYQIAMLQHSIYPDSESGTWQLETNHTLDFHHVSRGLSGVPRQLGYIGDVPRYFSTRGLQPLHYVSQVIRRMGYERVDTAPLLALYDRHVGAAYRSATDVHAPLPDKKTARELLRQMGEIWRYPQLTRGQKLDFVMRRGRLSELDLILTTGTPYTLAAEMFPYYQENHYA